VHELATPWQPVTWLLTDRPHDNGFDPGKLMPGSRQDVI